MFATASLGAAAVDERQATYRDDVTQARQGYEQRLRACRGFAGQARVSCDTDARAHLVGELSIAKARHGGTPQAAYRASLADSAAAYHAASAHCALLEESAERRGCVAEAREQRDRARTEAREALEAFTDRVARRSPGSSRSGPIDCSNGESTDCREPLRAMSGP